VLRRRGALADPVSDDDITRAIKKLRCLGGGLDLVAIGRASYVRSVPGELNLDKNRALEIAQVGGMGTCVHACERVCMHVWLCIRTRAVALLNGCV
jgi:ESCRT-II complex subunit VPS22